MALAAWQATIVNSLGDIQASASVEVIVEQTGALAALFSDRDGASGISNPITADSSGFVRFYAAGNSLKITATKGAFSRIWRHVAVGMLAEQDAVEGDSITYDTTAAEISGSVTPVNKKYRPGYVDRYGTNTTPGTTDMTAAWTAAFACGEKVIHGSGAIYRISGQIVGQSDVLVEGNGSTLKATTRWIGGMLHYASKNRIRVRNLKFDLGKTAVATYTEYDDIYNAGVYLQTCDDVLIGDCEFTNLYTIGIYAHSCTGAFTLRRNRHTSPTQTQQLQMQHVHIQTCNFRAVIRDCDFVNAEPASAAVVPAGIFASGTLGSILIDGNYFNWCGRDNTGAHRLGAVDFYGDSENVTVTNNVSHNTMAQFTRLSSIRNLEFAFNEIEMADGAEAATHVVSVESTIVFVGTGQVGIQQANIHHNKITDAHSANRIGIGLSSYDYAVPLTDVAVHHNTFVGMQYTVFSGGVFSGLAIHHNRARGDNGNIIKVAIAPGGVTVTDDAGVLENASACEMLAIDDNTSVDESASSNPILCDFTKSPAYSGVVTNIAVRRNSVRSVTNAGAAIVVAGTSGTSIERVYAADNDIDGYLYALAISECFEVHVVDNKSRNIATDFLLSTNNGAVHRRGNRTTTGNVQGRAVLAAGTVSVSTAEVKANDNILLNRVVLGGTVGHLSIGTITAGTSFVINSSSASDTSTVFWEIVH